MNILHFPYALDVFFLVLQVAISFLGAIAAILQVGEYWLAHRVREVSTFPIRVLLPVKCHSLQKLLMGFVEYLDNQRFAFDVVVGVHYGGIVYASDIARMRYKPLRLIETRFEIRSGVAVCEGVVPQYLVEDVVGKSILLVDNRIKSGQTLERARQQLLSDGAASVTTVAIFRPKGAKGNADYVLLERWSGGEKFVR